MGVLAQGKNERSKASSRRFIGLVVGCGLAVAGFATPTAAATPKCFGHAATIVGTNGPDRIHGTGQSDVIVAGRGHDIVQSFGGDDLVCGGQGADMLILNGGADKGNGQRGDDGIRGRGGDDLLKGGRDGDYFGGLVGGSGDDRLLGGEGRDYLSDRLGANVYRGGLGNDLMQDFGRSDDFFLEAREAPTTCSGRVPARERRPHHWPRDGIRRGHAGWSRRARGRRRVRRSYR